MRSYGRDCTIFGAVSTMMAPNIVQSLPYCNNVATILKGNRAASISSHLIINNWLVITILITMLINNHLTTCAPMNIWPLRNNAPHTTTISPTTTTNVETTTSSTDDVTIKITTTVQRPKQLAANSTVTLSDIFETISIFERNELVRVISSELRLEPHLQTRLDASPRVMEAAKNVSSTGDEIQQLSVDSVPNIYASNQNHGSPVNGITVPDTNTSTRNLMPPSIVTITPDLAAERSTFISSLGDLPPTSVPSVPRPFYGDVFYSFQNVYWPIHCVICLIICTLGIFANVTNIIVLTRPNMITAVNTILSAMALSDLVVNTSNIPYLIHELGNSNDAASFFSFGWTLYILLHAHITVTAHTISIWLTCVLATWRYLVVCRSTSSNQRNWSIQLALRAIVSVFILVPIFCIPNYLSFAIVREKTESNETLFKVGFSHLADETHFIKTFHFWIFSVLTKLFPCVLLTFFTTVLIRKLLKARKRRERLTSYGKPKVNDVARLSIAGENQSPELREVICSAIPNGGFANNKNSFLNVDLNNNAHDTYSRNNSAQNYYDNEDIYDEDRGRLSAYSGDIEHRENNQHIKLLKYNTSSQYPADTEIAAPIGGNNSPDMPDPLCGEIIVTQQSKVMSHLIVESINGDSNNTTTTTLSTTTGPNYVLASCDTTRPTAQSSLRSNDTYDPMLRSSSTCGPFELSKEKLNEKSSNEQTSSDNLQNLSGLKKSLRINRGSLSINTTNLSAKFSNNSKLSEKRASEATIASRGRSFGSTTLAPSQMKLQTTQKQRSQNETTTRLLIAVMIVFLICEFPAGILAALCAIFGQEFFDNVYQPMGIVTDLLALLNSSVNFILYCFMSTQFRVTFYRTVLHCPAPTVPPK